MKQRILIRYQVLIVGLLVFLTTPGWSQSEDNTIKYIFNADGQLLRIDGLTNDYPILSPKSVIMFCIEDYNNTLKKSFEPMFNKYLNAYLNLQKEENQIILQNYFGFSQGEIDSLRQAYVACLSFLNMKFTYISSLTFLGITEICCDTYHVLPAAVEFETEIYSKLFTLNILISNSQRPISHSFIKDATFQGEDILSIINSTKNNTLDGFRYDLRFASPESRFVEFHSRDIQKFMPDKKSFDEIVDLFKKSVRELQKIDSNIKAKSLTGVPQTCDEIKKVIEEVQSIESEYYIPICDYLKRQKNWVKLFLWYTDGVPSLIPFELALIDKQDDKKRSENDTIIALKNIEILSLTEKKNALLTILNKNHICCGTNIEILPDTLYAIEKEINKAKLEIKKATDRNLNIDKRDKKTQTSETERKLQRKLLLQKNEFLYEGKIVMNQGSVRNSSGNIYIREHNAENSFSPMNRFKNNYDEESRIIILLENRKKQIKFSQSITLIKDVSNFEQQLNPVLDNMGTFIKDFETQTNKNSAPATCDAKFPTNFVEDLYKKRDYFNTILNYHDGFEYFQHQPDTSKRKSQDTCGTTSPNLTSYKNVYTMELDSHKYSFDYRVNKTYIFWPTAGFIYSFAKDPEVKINSDGTLQTKYFSGMHLLAGLKIHPWRTSIMDPSFVISCNRRPFIDYRKFYFVIGIDVLNIPKIYYIGSGIDLWSGLSLTAGTQLIVKEQQTYINGTVQSKEYLDWANLYIGINLDLTIAIKMVRFFAFK